MHRDFYPISGFFFEKTENREARLIHLFFKDLKKITMSESEEEEKKKLQLLQSVENNDVKAVDALIRAGADLNKQNQYGSTALIQASWYGYTKIALALVQAGADLDVQNSACSDPGRSGSRQA